MKKRIEKKKTKNTISTNLDEIKTDLLVEMKEELQKLKNEMLEKEAKLQMLETKQQRADIGSQRFGEGPWTDWISGNEKGYKRSMYVDIRGLSVPR